LPYLNGSGKWCAGVGSGIASYEGQTIAVQAGGTCFLDDGTVIYQGMDARLYAYVVRTSSKGSISPHGGNTIRAGGGIWAAWLPQNYAYPEYRGLRISSGEHLPLAALHTVGPDGAVAIKELYDSAGPHYVLEKDGTEWALSNGDIYDVQLLGNKQAVWRDYALGIQTTPDVPTPVTLSPEAFFLKMAEVDGKWYVCYGSPQGLVIHPAQDAGNPTILHPEHVDHQFYIDFKAVSKRLWYAYSLGQGDQPSDIVVGSLDAVGGTPGGTGTPGMGPATSSGVGMTLKSEATYPIADAATVIAEATLASLPAWPIQQGRGRIVHPLLGAYDYEAKPDEWVNIDADVIIPPVWASTRTMTGAINVLWKGNIRDVVVEERWTSIGGLAMPIAQIRMLYMIWQNPLDPATGYVQWYPNYISPYGYYVIPVNLTVGGTGLAFDDVGNYLDANGPDGWVQKQVAFTLKIVDRIPL
jgi:hypothetical protein